MDQRIRITEGGKVIVQTNNATITDDVTTTTINGDFLIDAGDVARLVVSKLTNKIAIGYTYYWHESQVCFKIVDKDHKIEEMLNKHTVKISQKNDTINALRKEIVALKSRGFFKRLLNR